MQERATEDREGEVLLSWKEQKRWDPGKGILALRWKGQKMIKVCEEESGIITLGICVVINVINIILSHELGFLCPPVFFYSGYVSRHACCFF